MTRRKQSLVRVSWTLPHACSTKFSAINHLANLKPAALPEYTHRSSERKPTSAPPRCCWGQFHHHCCCCTSGTPPSYTSRWSTTAGLNGSKLRKLPGTYEEEKRSLVSHQAAKVWVMSLDREQQRRCPSFTGQPQCTCPCLSTEKNGMQRFGAFPTLTHLPALWGTLMSTGFNFSCLALLKFLVNGTRKLYCESSALSYVWSVLLNESKYMETLRWK